MADNQKPCCSRRTGKLHHDQNNLRTLAKKAAAADQRGHSITRYKELMAEAKRQIEMDKQSIIDHEAEHAEETAA